MGKRYRKSRTSHSLFCPSRIEAPQKAPGDSGEVYHISRIDAAILTRNADNIALALDSWPEQLRAPERFPELYNLKKAEALLTLGHDGEARSLLLEVKSRLEALPQPYPVGWLANASYLPVELPGLMGDLPGVDREVAAYEADPPADQYSRLVDHFWAIAKAYARAGDPDSALDYLEKQVGGLGIQAFLRIRGEPAFDAIRNHPRYLAMKAGFESSEFGSGR